MKDRQKKIKYQVFIWTGVSFMGVGIVFMFTVNTVIGLALLAVGAGHLAIGLSARNQQK